MQLVPAPKRRLMTSIYLELRPKSLRRPFRAFRNLDLEPRASTLGPFLLLDALDHNAVVQGSYFHGWCLLIEIQLRRSSRLSVLGREITTGSPIVKSERSFCSPKWPSLSGPGSSSSFF